MSVLVRHAVPLDADPITAVFVTARRAGMPWLRVLHSPAETRWWIRTVVLPTTTVWVADEPGRVLGFAALRGTVLEHLYVHPEAWSRRIGTQLLDTARAEPAARLELYAFQRNARARRFYEARGFKLVALGTGATNEEREPDAYYEWRRGEPVMVGH